MASHSFGIKLYACQVSGGEMFPLGCSSDDTAKWLDPSEGQAGVGHAGQRLMITIDFFFSLQK